MSKITPKNWAIFYNEPSYKGDKCFMASFEYSDSDGDHETTKHFETYATAFGWLSERIKL